MSGEPHGVEIRLLGEPEAWVGGRAVAIGSAKQWGLLAALALEPGRRVPADRLAEVLWGDDLPAAAGATLRSLVYRVRRALQDAGGPADALRGRGSGYVLAVEREAVDACRFERLAADGRAALSHAEHRAAAESLRTGLGLWRGAALGRLADRRALRATADRLDGARLDVIEDLADAELALGLAGDALARLEPHLDAAPMRERAWALLMLALYRLGRQADALAAYERIRALLADELGAEPTVALRELHVAILQQRADLTPSPASGPGTAGDAPGIGRHNLPAKVTSFVGRTHELAEVAAVLAGARVVTLAGPGGAGKTRLAIEAAERLLPGFPDGVWLVELAALRDPEAVPYVIAAAVGLDPAALGPAGGAEALGRQLRSRRALLVLDNCEHLVDAVAGVVHVLLRACPQLAVLATSREVLAVPGEAVVRVGPLPLPPADAVVVVEVGASEAVELFCRRAGDASPGFALTAANAAAVARVCRRLDGIPLALELAAPRVRLLSASQLADRLDDRFRLLSGGPRTIEARHRTLLATLEWSHDLLPEPERVALRRLGVFPSDFGLAAAEAVVAGGPGLPGPPDADVLDLLAGLIDKSLLTARQAAEGEARYRLLETVSQFALLKLDEAGEGDRCHLRLRDFLTVERPWFSAAFEGSWLGWSAREAENVQAALEWCGRNGDDVGMLRLVAQQWAYWFLAGSPAARPWLERAVAVAGTGDVANRVLVRCGLGHVLRVAGDAASAVRSAALLDEAIRLAEGEGDRVAAAFARIYAAQVETVEGRPDEAERLLSRAIAELAAAGQDLAVAYGRITLSAVALLAGDLHRARELGGEVVSVMRRHPDNYWLAHALAQLALTEAVLGAPGAAAEHAAEAVAAARRLPGRRTLVMALVRAAEVGLIAGRPAAAMPVLDEALGLLRELGIRDWAADALDLAGTVVAAGRPEQAARLLGAAAAVRGMLREDDGVLGVLAERVRAGRETVAAALGGDRLAELEEAGAALVPEDALAEARDVLRATAG